MRAADVGDCGIAARGGGGVLDVEFRFEASGAAVAVPGPVPSSGAFGEWDRCGGRAVFVQERVDTHVGGSFLASAIHASWRRGGACPISIRVIVGHYRFSQLSSSSTRAWPSLTCRVKRKAAMPTYHETATPALSLKSKHFRHSQRRRLGWMGKLRQG